MTCMCNSLNKIPTDFSKKWDCPELYFCERFLKEQRDLVKEVEEAIAAMEKGYKAQAASIDTLSGLGKKQALEFGRFRYFLEAHQILAARFSEYSVRLGSLRNNKVAPLNQSFKTNYKSVVHDLGKIKTAFIEMTDGLTRMTKHHSGMISTLVESTNPNQRQAVLQGGLTRERINQFDMNNERVWNYYLQYRTRFLEFCKARDTIFKRSDALLASTAKEIKEIMDIAWQVDESLFEAGKKDGFVDTQKGMGLPVGFWDSEQQTRPSSGQFRVTVDRKIEVEGGRILSDNEVYVLVEAEGDNWKVKDRDGSVWEVPAESIVPMPKLPM